MADKNKSNVIAVCGKGGVGKTSISAIITGILSGDRSKKVLAIDADPAVGLATSLGFEARMTVDDVRNILISRIESRAEDHKDELLSLLDYEMLNALEEKGNLAFLAIGRPEKEGCYCQVNDILKDIIHAMADNFDYVVIDGEAGIEQVNRRVMERVDHIILVSDASAKGLNVVRTIKAVSEKSVSYVSAGLILNRIIDKNEVDRLDLPQDIDLFGWVPEDDVIRSFDIEGKSLLTLPACKAKTAVERAMVNIHTN